MEISGPHLSTPTKPIIRIFGPCFHQISYFHVIGRNQIGQVELEEGILRILVHGTFNSSSISSHRSARICSYLENLQYFTQLFH